MPVDCRAAAFDGLQEASEMSGDPASRPSSAARKRQEVLWATLSSCGLLPHEDDGSSTKSPAKPTLGELPSISVAPTPLTAQALVETPVLAEDLHVEEGEQQQRTRALPAPLADEPARAPPLGSGPPRAPQHGLLRPRALPVHTYFTRVNKKQQRHSWWLLHQRRTAHEIRAPMAPMVSGRRAARSAVPVSHRLRAPPHHSLSRPRARQLLLHNHAEILLTYLYL